jgi:hypothetical protein
MALEAAIRENTAALQALVAQLQGDAKAIGAIPTPKVEIQNSSPEYREPTEPSPTKNEQAKLNYERDVKPLALKLIAKDKPAWLNILDGWDVSKGTELKDDALPDVLEQVKAALRRG